MKRNSTINLWIKIGLSLIVAMALSIFPLPHALAWFRPAWVLLVLMFWIFAEPQHLSLSFIWLVGLYLDLLTETPLGQHTIPLLVVAYFLFKFQARLQIFPFVRQYSMIIVLIVIYYVIEYWLAGQIAHSSPWFWQESLAAIVTSVLWLVTYRLLEVYKSRLRKW